MVERIGNHQNEKKIEGIFFSLDKE